jgi:hypothetical protein
VDSEGVNPDALDGDPPAGSPAAQARTAADDQPAQEATRPKPAVSEVDVLGARVEGMGVMLRDMARVALAAAALAAVAVMLALYLLKIVRGLQAAQAAA